MDSGWHILVLPALCSSECRVQIFGFSTHLKSIGIDVCEIYNILQLSEKKRCIIKRFQRGRGDRNLINAKINAKRGRSYLWRKASMIFFYCPRRLKKPAFLVHCFYYYLIINCVVKKKNLFLHSREEMFFFLHQRPLDPVTLSQLCKSIYIRYPEYKHWQ